jgi:hypothetical protein
MRGHYVFIAILMAFFGLISPLFAQSPDVFTAKIERPHLYSVSKPGSPQSYLFGSYHYGLSADQLPSWALAAHDKAQIHAYEMPSKNEAEARVAAGEIKLIYQDPAGFAKSLDASKGPNSPQVMARLITLGVPQELAQWVREEKVVGAWDACSYVVFGELFRSGHILDFEMELRSHVLKKKILSLDSTKLRTEAAEDATKKGEPEAPCEITEFSIYSGLWVRQYVIKMLEDYIKGDEEKDEVDAGVVFRNRAWVRQLLPHMRENSVFVTAGAAHLYGEGGLIDLLREQGYTVERVTSPDAVKSASNAQEAVR